MFYSGAGGFFRVALIATRFWCGGSKRFNLGPFFQTKKNEEPE
jgi:hypothetical protein